MPATITRLSVEDLARRTNLSFLREARAKHHSLSTWMEKHNPTDKENGGPLDAFGRVMEYLDVKTRTVPQAGVYADELDMLLDPNAPDREVRRTLFHEWAWRQWRAAAHPVLRLPEVRAVQVTTDFPLNTAMRPYTDSLTPRDQTLSAAIPIDEVLALTEPIRGNAYRSVYVTEPAVAQKRMVRVGEGAEIPAVTMTLSSRTIDLYKYGRAIRWSYEVVRAQRFDRVALLLEQIATQAEIDKLATILDIMQNGDGNPNTGGTVTNMTSLDAAATPPNVTAKAYLAFKQLFLNPYVLTHILVKPADSLALQLLTLGNNNNPVATFPALLGSLTPINRSLRDAVRLGETTDAPTSKIIGFDSRRAVGRLVEEGSDVEETDNFITNQTWVTTMTQNEGFQVLEERGIQILNLLA